MILAVAPPIPRGAIADRYGDVPSQKRRPVLLNWLFGTVRSPVGRQPVNWLRRRYMCCSLERLPSEDGMLPLNELSLSQRWVKLERLPSDEGMLLLNELLLR